MKKIIFLLMLFANIVFANVGTLTLVEGKVAINREENNIDAFLGDNIIKKDIISTEANSRAKVTFNDQTIVTIGKSSSLNVEEFIFESSNKSSSQTELSVVEGAFHAITGEIGKANPSKFKIKTRNAVIGVRGTEIYGDQSKIICTKGAIFVESNGVTREIPEGHFIAVFDNEAPSEIKPLDSETLNLIQVQLNISNLSKNSSDNVYKDSSKGLVYNSSKSVFEIDNANIWAYWNSGVDTKEDVADSKKDEDKEYLASNNQNNNDGEDSTTVTTPEPTPTPDTNIEPTPEPEPEPTPTPEPEPEPTPTPEPEPKPEVNSNFLAPQYSDAAFLTPESVVFKLIEDSVGKTLSYRGTVKDLDPVRNQYSGIITDNRLNLDFIIGSENTNINIDILIASSVSGVILQDNSTISAKTIKTYNEAVDYLNPSYNNVSIFSPFLYGIAKNNYVLSGNFVGMDADKTIGWIWTIDNDNIICGGNEPCLNNSFEASINGNSNILTSYDYIRGLIDNPTAITNLKYEGTIDSLLFTSDEVISKNIINLDFQLGNFTEKANASFEIISNKRNIKDSLNDIILSADGFYIDDGAYDSDKYINGYFIGSNAEKVTGTLDYNNFNGTFGAIKK